MSSNQNSTEDVKIQQMQPFKQVAEQVINKILDAFSPSILIETEDFVSHVRDRFKLAFLTIRPVEVLLNEPPEGEQLATNVIGKYKNSYHIDVRYLYGEIYIYLQQVPVE